MSRKSQDMGHVADVLDYSGENAADRYVWLETVRALANEGQEFGASFLLLTEAAQHG
jgi:hypothetical protein